MSEDICPASLIPNRQPCFFDAGLRFECRQCGACCVGDPGTVYVSAAEIAHLAEHRRLSISELTRQYLYPFKDSFSIGEDADGRCLFYDQGCTIYPVRPNQCRTFPFWLRNLRSERSWLEIRKQCPGIGLGRCYSHEEILDLVRTTCDI